MDDSKEEENVCRVCRLEGAPDKPLFYPCMCNGSIKYVHQECLEEWLRHCKHDYCELCKYRFTFAPVYAPDMPENIPIMDIIYRIGSSFGIRVRTLVHLGLLILVWVYIIPYTIGRIYRSICETNFDYVITLPFDMISSINKVDELYEGLFVSYCLLVPFCGMVFLYYQLLHIGGPGWLLRPLDVPNAPVEVNNENGQQPQARAVPLRRVPRQAARGVRQGNRYRERIIQYLGFDGSFAFIRNAIFIAYSSALFIFIFSIFPYYMGSMAITTLALESTLSGLTIEAFLTTLCGYCVIHVLLLIMHRVVIDFGMDDFKRTISISYMFVKTLILVSIDFGILPLCFGWWLDVCSFPIFGISMRDRLNTQSHPYMSILFHWVAGAVFIYYCVSSLLLIKDVVRPELLGHLKYIYRPDMKFLKDLLQKDMPYHVIRLITTTLILGIILCLVVWSPVHIILSLWPTFFPYNMSKDSYYNEYSFEILLFWTLIPEMLYPTDTYNKWKMCVEVWCETVTYLFGINSILRKNVRQPTPDVPPPAAPSNQQSRRDVPKNNTQPPPETINIELQLQAMKILVILSVIGIGLAVLTIPVFLGRVILSLEPGLFFFNSQVSTNSSNLYDVYTATCGFSMYRVVMTAVRILMRWREKGHTFIKPLLKFYLIMGLKTLFGMIVLFSIIPMLLGILIELVIVDPFRVPLHQTPIMWLWGDLTVGMKYVKYAGIIILIGPSCIIKRILLRTIVNNFLNVPFKLIMRNLVMPVISVLSLSLAIPYTIANGIAPLFVDTETTKILIGRYIYPAFIFLEILVLMIITHIEKYKKLKVKIRDEKYLVSRRLVNYTR